MEKEVIWPVEQAVILGRLAPTPVPVRTRVRAVLVTNALMTTALGAKKWCL